MKLFKSVCLFVCLLVGSVCSLRAQDDAPPKIQDLHIVGDSRDVIAQLDYTNDPGHIRAYVKFAAALPAAQAPGAWKTIAGLYQGFTPVALKVDASGDLVTGADPGGPVTSCTACIVVGGLNGFTPVALNVGSDGTVITSGGGGGGTVTSVSGTANQIDVATGTTTPVISLDSALHLPGTLSSATAGAASTPSISLTGTIFTGGTGTTTVPLIYQNNGSAPTTWNTSGTFFGFNAPSGYNGCYLDWHINGGGSLFSVCDSNGDIFTAGSVTASVNVLTGSAIGINSKSLWTSGTNGIWTATNFARNGFTRLSLGPDTTSFPALCPSGTTLQIMVAGACTTSAPTTAASFQTNDSGGFGANMFYGFAPCETNEGITTVNTGSATTTTGLNCVPAAAIIDSVVIRTTTTITTAASFEVGVSGSLARYCAAGTTNITAGNTTVCTAQINGGASFNTSGATAIVVTFNATPGAGAMRIGVFYHLATAPTS